MAEETTLKLGDYLASRLKLSTKERSAWQALFNEVMQQLDDGHTLLANTAQRQALLKQLPEHLLTTPERAKQGVNTPLIATDQYIWLQRVWAAEYRVAAWLLNRAKVKPKEIEISRIEPYLTTLKTTQRQAVLAALCRPLTIITGGPGTGKTYTIAQLVQALLQLYPDCYIQLAAPTGKAANRMETTLLDNLPDQIIQRLPPAKTIHRLLGITPSRGARYHRYAPLDVDVLIIDEASMLSLELMQQLTQALPDKAQVIFLGDAHQLAAVEPGAVLHDITQAEEMSSCVVTLTQSTRFSDESVIGQLALAVLAGDESSFFDTLGQSGMIWQSGAIQSLSQGGLLYDQLFAGFKDYIAKLEANADVTELYTAFDRYRILCAGYQGNLGSDIINKMLRQRHLKHTGQIDKAMFYHGQPLMILANDPQLGLFNGDIGLCLHHDDSSETYLHFVNYPEPISTSRISLKNITDAYALSIHKSQGSEFNHVSVCIDPAQQRLMSRELLYTAITRAKETVSFYGDKALFSEAINTPTQRLTGLELQMLSG